MLAKKISMLLEKVLFSGKTAQIPATQIPMGTRQQMGAAVASRI